MPECSFEVNDGMDTNNSQAGASVTKGYEHTDGISIGRRKGATQPKARRIASGANCPLARRDEPPQNSMWHQRNKTFRNTK
ncbi:hypothetical protein R1flu_027899 [Riccia fluitans]|uniref:Uncharacterized protein n=1 Tax=Riccia fluitans TaxID=41844 RepID=A0ABD1XN31_9MARC